jgi:cytochrome c-type biogenesis protein CcmF
MGYVGFSVAFAFAIAALLGGRLDAAWARWSRPWTNVAWAFLSLGIMLGSWWAYYELGWGGWWFWDPVENASFMPWLAGTALMHSLAVTEKRGLFKSWTVLLAIFAFSLSLLGTFLVRSGRADLGARLCHRSGARPVHPGVPRHRRRRIADPVRSASADGTQPRIGFGPVSRESLLLVNNVVFLVATLTVLFGTLFPLLMDALGQGKYSVGRRISTPFLCP